ncbi:MAG: HAMP domain-containing protein [Spirochaetes bacterium]|jgi:methyl-accepting chemotaxis protein|nr:HAMP domain-containing protein [Spirochaetota bacterium]
MTINTRLVFFLIVLPVLLLGATGYLTFRAQRDLLFQQVVREEQIQSREIANGVSAQAAEIRKVTVGLSRVPAVREYVRTAPPPVYTRAAFESTPGYENYITTLEAFDGEDVVSLYSVSAQTGVLMHSEWADLPAGYDGRDTDYYNGAVQTSGFYVTDPYLNPDGTDGLDPTAMTVSYPIRSEDDELLGVLAIDVSLRAVRGYVADQIDGDGTDIWLYTGSGAVVYHPDLQGDEEVPYLDAAFSASGLEPTLEMTSRFTMSEERGFTVPRNQGGDLLIATAPVSGLPWRVAVAVPENRITSRIAMSLLRTTGASLAVFVVFLAAITFLLSRRVTVPIRRTAAGLSEISEGAGDLTRRLPAARSDEIGTLARAFNAFAEKLNSIVVGIKGSTASAEKVGNNLSVAAEQTTSAMEQIAANVASMRDRFATLEQTIDSNAGAVGSITTSIEGVVNQITEQTAMVEESTASVNEMLSSLESVAANTSDRRRRTTQLSETSRAASTQLRDANRMFSEGVSAKVDSIREAADAIQDVAAQTNLLAMNAAIEAAHAGEAGKGFAVVADEIRKLAENTSESSARIAATVKDVVASIQQTGAAVTSAEREFGTVIEETEHTVETFSEIESSTAELSEAGREILSAMTSLQTTTNDIRDRATAVDTEIRGIQDSENEIRSIATESAGGIREVTTGIDEVNTAMRRVSELVEELGQLVDRINKGVGAFRTESE